MVFSIDLGGRLRYIPPLSTGETDYLLTFFYEITLKLLAASLKKEAAFLCKNVGFRVGKKLKMQDGARILSVLK